MGVVGGVSAAQEIAVLRSAVATEAPGFRVLIPQLECSEYFEGQCNLLDHIIVTRQMTEVDNVVLSRGNFADLPDGPARLNRPGETG